MVHVQIHHPNLKFMLTLRQTCEHADVNKCGRGLYKTTNQCMVYSSVMLYNSSHLS